MSCGPNEAALRSKVGKANAGAGLPTKGEGISCGLRVKPTARKPTKTKNSPRGIKNFFMPSLSP
jgi:hypothetical protein